MRPARAGRTIHNSRQYLKFGQFDVLLDGELIASKGGFWKRKLVHGAPPHARILEAIGRALAGRAGDAWEVPKAREV